jgi:hypothetical protein
LEWQGTKSDGLLAPKRLLLGSTRHGQLHEEGALDGPLSRLRLDPLGGLLEVLPDTPVSPFESSRIFAPKVTVILRSEIATLRSSQVDLTARLATDADVHDDTPCLNTTDRQVERRIRSPAEPADMRREGFLHAHEAPEGFRQTLGPSASFLSAEETFNLRHYRVHRGSRSQLVSSHRHAYRPRW